MAFTSPQDLSALLMAKEEGLPLAVRVTSASPEEQLRLPKRSLYVPQTGALRLAKFSRGSAQPVCSACADG